MQASAPDPACPHRITGSPAPTIGPVRRPTRSPRAHVQYGERCPHTPRSRPHISSGSIVNCYPPFLAGAELSAAEAIRTALAASSECTSRAARANAKSTDSGASNSVAAEIGIAFRIANPACAIGCLLQRRHPGSRLAWRARCSRRPGVAFATTRPTALTAWRVGGRQVRSERGTPPPPWAFATGLEALGARGWRGGDVGARLGNDGG